MMLNNSLCSVTLELMGDTEIVGIVELRDIRIIKPETVNNFAEKL